jgi:hypothetical protein
MKNDYKTLKKKKKKEKLKKQKHKDIEKQF